VVEFLVSHDITFNTARTAAYGVCTANYAVLEYLEKKFSRAEVFTFELLLGAIHYRSLPLVQYMIETKGVPLDLWTYGYAMNCGYRPILEYFHPRARNRWSPEELDDAFEQMTDTHFRNDALNQLLDKTNKPLNELTCLAAFKAGLSFADITLLIEFDAPFSEEAYIECVRRGKLDDFVSYLSQNEVFSNSSECREFAEELGFQDIANYIQTYFDGDDYKEQELFDNLMAIDAPLEIAGLFEPEAMEQ